MEFYLHLGGLWRHLGGLSHPKPKPSYVHEHSKQLKQAGKYLVTFSAPPSDMIYSERLGTFILATLAM